ncbi:MAG: Membrane alanine aminopeptidase N (EC [uncultured Thiotrichaceae bacterium]|uniref:Aminopeptidase N n=1 Tax=uncultured Thiotrichaceae bacterium TaxID=298394 RepID=A0A6S6TW78_9GAMM|nr:MAG: Membrane alanine aminopeptidase N (EC [uncultured Thiotrichaceae bacterium]
MKESQPQAIHLEDYSPADWHVDGLQLQFELADDKTCVTSTMQLRRTDNAISQSLKLDGEELELQWVKVNGKELPESAYNTDDVSLLINDLPDIVELQTQVVIYPQNNTSLEGLYQSSGNFCTQCEAQGFRKISYYFDRPDVMTKFTTTIIADKEKYPVLLSNGNLIEQGETDEGKQCVVWQDPHKKPAYLFALVGGDLEHIEDSYTTQSGRDVVLKIYTEAHNIDRCDHAMGSLKRAMKWDEERFGLEYDLDIYMIVAVDDFNMGAMENKGLNVFNSSLVFASPETATDTKYIYIEAVIGHEYFHNWTGNRVTCRDWFQLSLKEGLTVFRDQEFTADLHSRPVKRIEDVRHLRAAQFAEDASPMAHPIRPASYIEINNFYTLTVYEKGAEVVRLYQTLLGRDGFRKGIDLYFERHDGQAVTTEDFLTAMADANGKDLSQMQNWYTQAGTPVVNASMTYDADAQTCTLNFTQSCPATPESDDKQPFLIPVEMGLLNADGTEIPLQLEGERAAVGTSRMIPLTDTLMSVTFINVAEQPVPSLFRGFSAPIRLEYAYSADDLTFLMANDSDAFNRWQAGQELAMQTLLGMVEASTQQEAFGLEHSFIEAFQKILNDTSLDAALRAEALALPGCGEVAERIGKNVDPDAVFQAVEFMKRTLANALRIDFDTQFEQLANDEEYKIDPVSMGERQLKNLCLMYLSYVDDEGIAEQCYTHFSTANNMTESMAGLAILSHMECPQSEQSIQEFYTKWSDNVQVMDAWFSVQAASRKPTTLACVTELMGHEKFSMKNPNKVRSLVGSFSGNFSLFHAEDGSGYAFLADRVLELDTMNPQVASRMVRALMKWKQYETGRAELMKQQLTRILAKDGLSGDVYEIVSKSLA